MIGGKLSVALLQHFEDSDKIFSLCQDVRRTNKDTHLIFSQIGEKLGLVPERTVAAAFATLWAQANKEEVQEIISKVAQGAEASAL